MSCYCSHTHRIWRNKEVRVDNLKSSFQAATQVTERWEVFWNEKYSLTLSRNNARKGTYFRKPKQSHFCETENRKRVLTIPTHLKTNKSVVENGYDGQINVYDRQRRL